MFIGMEMTKTIKGKKSFQDDITNNRERKINIKNKKVGLKQNSSI